MTTEDRLKADGWTKQNTIDEPRLTELVDMYKDIGLEDGPLRRMHAPSTRKIQDGINSTRKQDTVKRPRRYVLNTIKKQ